jgi:NMD protein affecting ribosome stability and mRNA decay
MKKNVNVNPTDLNFRVCCECGKRLPKDLQSNVCQECLAEALKDIEL